MTQTVTIAELNAMKRAGRKIVGVVVWDSQMAAIADRVGVEIVSVGDSIGINLWGRDDSAAVTLEEMLIVARAVRAGTQRALLSCDLPLDPARAGPRSALEAARRLAAEAGVDMVKLDGAADRPDAVAAIARAGIPVWAQFGVTPAIARAFGIPYQDQAAPGTDLPVALEARLVAEAERLESAGAALLDFKNSGPAAGAAVTAAVAIPVIGGFGGGPWLDGRVRMANAAIGYAARNVGEDIDAYANVAETAYRALGALSDDVRAARQIKGVARPKA
ncbi:MAG TPA: 3-methyl-2-oxobutanoate hydroxymethyltransferase [Gammaproteobacteria bacterium]|nr:3-methyl-2-oxobutanoate hydroxymethyltransferase [Gammaproteobacteria bacterium]